MSEFTELDLNKDVADMEAQEAKQTLSEFMEAHKKNKQAYDSKAAEVDAVEDEYSEEIETLEEQLAEFREARAEKASEYVNMPPELLSERFSLDELEQIVEEGEQAAEFSEEPDAGDESPEEDDGNLTTFAEREEKGRREGSSGRSKYRERAKERLEAQGFPVSN